MKRGFFTLIELLVAMAVMLLVSQFLLTIFTRTSEVASAHVKSMELYAQAQNVLDRLQEDTRRMNQMIKDPNIGLFGRMDSTTPLASGIVRTPFSLAFVTSNYDIRQDMELSKGDGADSASFFDGWSQNKNSEFKGSDGMQEVAYYMSREDRDIPTWTLHRALRSPIGGSGSLLGLSSTDFLQPTFQNNHKLADDIIYMDVSYLGIINNSPTLMTTYAVSSASAQKHFPGALNIRVCFASGLGAAQSEGDIISATATQLVVKKTNGNFPKAQVFPTPNPPNNQIRNYNGFLLVGRGLGAGIFEFTGVFICNNNYYFIVKTGTTGGYKISTTQTQARTPVIVGHTFSRSYHIR